MKNKCLQILLPILAFCGGLFPGPPASGQTNLEFHLKGRWPGFARGDAFGVQVAGPYAYVVQWSGGLGIYDISNPGNVIRVGGYDTPGYALRVQVAGSTAYVADAGSGLQILDVKTRRTYFALEVMIPEGSPKMCGWWETWLMWRMETRACRF